MRLTERMLSWVCFNESVPRFATHVPLLPRSEPPHRMSFTVFLGNLPVWVTADDIKSWLNSENLVADNVKVIRNPETQESKGFAFIDAPNSEEMNSIIRRFDRAPLEDKLLRANPAQPPKGKGQPIAAAPPRGGGQMDRVRRPQQSVAPQQGAPQAAAQNGPPAGTSTAGVNRNAGGRRRSGREGAPQSAFAEELAKAL